MHQVLAEHLVLSGSSEDASQAIAMGDDNMVSVQVEVVSSGGALSNGVTFTLEGSNDLENWSTNGLSSLFQATTYDTPSVTQLPTYTGANSIGYPFVRVRYTNTETSTAVVLRAGIYTSKASA